MKSFPILLSIVLVFCSRHLADAADRPNFVWLLSEDNSMHYLQLFDDHGAPAPRIEQLANDGLKFVNAYSNAPVCSVARTTLITGCYAPRIFTQFHRRSVLVPLPGDLKMFPAYLRDAGYYTTNRQKKDYNAIEGPGVWDESSRRASWRHRKPAQPFFHMQSFGTTHEGSLHFSRQNMLSHKTTTDPKTVFVAPYHPDTEIFRYTNARYRDNIRKVDEEIGEVIDQLREDGLLEDTFIFYFGDHGGVLPRSKGYAYDSGLHVPLVVRVPSKWQHLVAVPRGSSVSGFVSFADFGPTLLHLAGLTVPEECDGSPFLGRGISQSDLAERDLAVGYADRFDEKYDLVRTVRKGKFEYVRSYQPFLFDGLQNNYRYKMLAYREWRELFREGKLNEIQSQFFRSRPAELLFDLEADPHETRNLADDPQFAAVLNDLRTTNQNWVKSMPDLSFFPESVLVESAADDPVSFGAKQKERIGRLVDIADLNLVPFETAAVAIDRALQSQDPWERYWGLIVCSSHGDDAKRFAERARQLAKSDPERLVRTRAAEFLAIIRADDPQPTILDVLRKTDSGVEAALVLNTLTFLRDGAGYPFDGLSAELFQPAVLKNDSVQRRLEYLLK